MVLKWWLWWVYFCIFKISLLNFSEFSILNLSITETLTLIWGNGEKAITHYNVLKDFNGLSLVHIVLETGRTHQIRVHFSHIGHPVLGDTLYGNPSNLISRQALHSFKVSFIHPISQEKLSLEAPIPDDMKIL